jgi:fructose-1,6-bisphosphatase II / sedoheptulose-1,7-bisphosphatase
VAGVIAAAMPDSRRGHLSGASGGAPEGVLAAAALRCSGGQMQGRLMFEDDGPDWPALARAWAITDPKRIYRIEEMAGGDG